MEVIELTDDNREEWLAFRRNGIGGSDAPSLMGLDPVSGPLALYVEKAGTRLEVDDVPHEAAYWGRVLEGIVADEFARRSGMRVEKPTRMYRNAKYPWMLGTVDRNVYDPKHPVYAGVFEVPCAILECKTTSVRREHLWDDGVPPVPYCQVQHYLAVSDLPMAYVAVLIGGQQFRYYDVPRSESYIAKLVEVEEAFWECVRTGTPPPVDGTDSTVAILNQRYAEAVAASSVELTTEVLDAVELLSLAKRAGSINEREQKRLENVVKAALGHAEYGMRGNEVVVTWKQAERRSLDTDRLKLDMPEVVDGYTRVTKYRTLRVARSRASGEAPEAVEQVEGDTAREVL